MFTGMAVSLQDLMVNLSCDNLYLKTSQGKKNGQDKNVLAYFAKGVNYCPQKVLYKSCCLCMDNKSFFERMQIHCEFDVFLSKYFYELLTIVLWLG